MRNPLPVVLCGNVGCVQQSGVKSRDVVYDLLV